ncbi:hypothetical protein CDD81_977 [Ophiocordyceps australis]|uniref:1,3-beta-glucanosyltransferase n=1 Tax=Ophiocordyceps australis TaxID=1399860 RepID=A0A2C5Y2A7_9HYPO|nr:hypothetical protein CDD81_977 [Ophiocordyceps australis]
MPLSKLSLAALALAGSVLAADLQPIEVKGSKFFYKNGTQFYIKGVAYQQDTSAAGGESGSNKYIDPLANEANCKRDIPLLKELGTNTIRTYAIDPEADHTACMRMLNDNGIYVVSDLSEPSLSINRNTPQWTADIFARYTKVVDELSKYPNVIGFFAGNEVSNQKNNTGASAYVKAAVRDTKAYIKSKNTRWMGVGYAANDDQDIRKEIADYFNCGKPEEAIDFWGYNIYSWCGQSTLQKSGYDKQIEFFQDYSVPVFFAEYGCNNDGAANRIFEETGALYGDQMTKVFSGGIVYMYFQEANDFGLVEVKGGKATQLKDFEALKNATRVQPKAIERDSYNPTAKPQQCPDSKTDTWRANSALPPTPDQSLCSCMTKSRTCVRKQGLSDKSFGDMFGFICGAAPEICTAIQGNASMGVYGAYSMCSDGEKLDYVLDAYYRKLNKAADACDFKGQAGVQRGAADSSCDSKLARASDINRQVATATAPVSAASPTTTDDSFAMPGAPISRVFAVGDYAVGLYMLVAMFAGLGMVAL